jgi:class 3 adenylate cyclase
MHGDVADSTFFDTRHVYLPLLDLFSSKECMSKVKQVTKLLEPRLGPGTGDLRMRFGIHSGPVMAGVLPGAHARIQLFGDTVTTAGRMENMGEKNRIHASEATAEHL